MKTKPWYITLGIILSLLVLTLSITLYAYSTAFYMTQHDLNNIPQVTGMERDELVRVTQGLIDYIRGDLKDLNMEAVINGKTQWVYGEREIAHMVDVEVLFNLVNVLRTAFAVLFIGGWGFMAYKPKLRKDRMKPFIAQGLVTIALAGAILLMTLVDFSSAFEKFHKIFFTNDLWILDPRTDVLIQMLPQIFFETMAKYMAGTWFALSMILMVFGFMFDRRIQKAK